MACAAASPTVERRIRDARFPAVKSLESFDPPIKSEGRLSTPSQASTRRWCSISRGATSSPGARVRRIRKRSSGSFSRRTIALGPSGTGKTHAVCGIGLAACQRGVKTRFATAAAIVHEMIEAQDEKRLLRLQKTLASYELLIIDELGFVPLSRTGAELLFELISQRYERGATIITSNLPFDEWTATFGDERLTGALLDRLTHHVHILEMNGPSYRLAQSRSRKRPD